MFFFLIIILIGYVFFVQILGKFREAVIAHTKANIIIIKVKIFSGALLHWLTLKYIFFLKRKLRMCSSYELDPPIT